MAEQIIFYNGKWYPAYARPSFLDFEFFSYQHALHYASSAFEGARCYPNLTKKDGTVNLIGVDLRVERLFKSLEHSWMKLPPKPTKTWDEFAMAFPELTKKYKNVFKGKIRREETIQFPYNKTQVKDFIVETILINLFTSFVKPLEGCYVRPVAFRGVNAARGLGVFSLGHACDFLIAVKPWGKYLGQEAFEKGAPVVVAEEGNEEMNRQNKLACNYLTGQRLVNFASYNHFNEILLTDSKPDRNILEGSGENLVFYEGNNQFVSPSQTRKAILPGCTLKVVDEMIRLMGGKVVYRDIPLLEVLGGKFQGAIMTGTAAEVTPVSLVFDPKTNNVVEIPLAKEMKDLQKNYLDCVHGLDVPAPLKKLQEKLIIELKWVEKEHHHLSEAIEKN